MDLVAQKAKRELNVGAEDFQAVVPPEVIAAFPSHLQEDTGKAAAPPDPFRSNEDIDPILSRGAVFDSSLESEDNAKNASAYMENLNKV